MMPFEDPDFGIPPWWLQTVLRGPRDLVAATGDPFRAVQRLLPDDDIASLGMQRFLLGVPTTYFVVVESQETDLVISLHALVWERETLDKGAWWTLVEGGWIRERPPVSSRDRLRWLPHDDVDGVARGIEQHFVAAGRAHRPDSLRARIIASASDGTPELIAVGPVHLGWVGRAGGVSVRVGDRRPAEQPLDPMLWADLSWLGWEPPSSGARDAWFEAAGPAGVEVATDLIVRTLAMLDQAEARRRRERGLEVMRDPVSRALIEALGSPFRVDEDEAGGAAH